MRPSASRGDAVSGTAAGLPGKGADRGAGGPGGKSVNVTVAGRAQEEVSCGGSTMLGDAEGLGGGLRRLGVCMYCKPRDKRGPPR